MIQINLREKKKNSQIPSCLHTQFPISFRSGNDVITHQCWWFIMMMMLVVDEFIVHSHNRLVFISSIFFFLVFSMEKYGCFNHWIVANYPM